MARTRARFLPTVALAWLFVAVLLTIWWGPLLGLRGWCWLGLHHLLCAIGVSHELIYRGWWKGRAMRIAEAQYQALLREQHQGP